MSNKYWKCEANTSILFGLFSYKTWIVYSDIYISVVQRIYILGIPIFSKELT